MLNLKSILTFLTVAVAMAFQPAIAQNYPSKPIRLVVGFPPGGSSDIAARIFAEAIGRELKQSVVVENMPGAGGNIAANAIIRANPDGYTIFYATSSIVLGPLVYPNVKFDATTDFTPIALTATNPLLLVVSSQVPAKTAKEFVTWSKGQKVLNYASTGSGTMTHLPGAAFSKQFGLNAVHIPYKGAAPAMVDLAAGESQFMISAMSEAMPRLKDGRIRALAITSATRSKLFPDVPTMKEATGATNYEMGGWQGIFLPKGASPEVIAKLNAAINAVINDPDVQAKFAPHGTELLGGTAEHFMQFIKTEQVRWKKIIQEAGAQVG